MTLSVWRYAHLSLAIISFLFIIMASITGAILSFDAITERNLSYKAQDFNSLTLSQSVPVVKDNFEEVLEISVDANQFVTIEGFDAEGNDIKKIINPKTAEVLANPIEKSKFIQWVTSLHRSLFLHETGRFIVGVVSFLLLLITCTGVVLIIKRQQGIKNFFSKITKDYFAQYYHVAGGRLLLLPILIISLTGTYLFLNRFEVIPQSKISEAKTFDVTLKADKKVQAKDFSTFKNIYLKDINKIEFPFDDDPQEFYKIKFKDKEIEVHQYTGAIVSETTYPKAKVLETLSLDLHTGRTNAIWAAILGIAAINILFFIWSGFVITFKRTKTKIAKNKISANQAEFVILVGSENGSTLSFANKIHEQLLSFGKASYITQMNQMQHFTQASHLLIFTSTYGIGEAPTNAKKFETLISSVQNSQKVQIAIVGFGSRAYTEFCGFAYKVQNMLHNTSWAKILIPVHAINDKSPEEFSYWVKILNTNLDLSFNTDPSNYIAKKPKCKTFKVVEVTKLKPNDTAFTVTFSGNHKFQSGDLLAIYPENNYKERLYSIGKINGQLKLFVKLHEFGLGSQYLYNLQTNQEIKARIVKNKAFHFPKAAKEVICISNGTGIAPFLGMINENKNKVNIKLFAGFRFNNPSVKDYQAFLDNALVKNKLQSYQLAFSKEEKQQYVMDLILENQKDLIQSIENGAVLMLCGSLAMQKDVENVLEQLLKQHQKQDLEFYKSKGQFLTDCY